MIGKNCCVIRPLSPTHPVAVFAILRVRRSERMTYVVEIQSHCGAKSREEYDAPTINAA